MLEYHEYLIDMDFSAPPIHVRKGFIHAHIIKTLHLCEFLSSSGCSNFTKVKSSGKKPAVRGAGEGWIYPWGIPSPQFVAVFMWKTMENI